MFTGIVQAQALVLSMHNSISGMRLVLDIAPLLALAPSHRRPLLAGDSIAINGCCLTIVEGGALQGDGTDACFDVIPESLQKTALSQLAAGQTVHAEYAMVAGEPFGGHVVQGHIDGVGVLQQRVQEANGAVRLVIKPKDANWMTYVIPQGSVTLDGVSLTVARFSESEFEVALIPETLQLTHLGELPSGSELNLEADPMVKTVQQLMHRMGKA